jgi:hypothetical protein
MANALGVASLNNLVVPTSDIGGGANQGIIQPKLMHRYRVTFINFGVSATSGLQLTKQVVSASRPNITFAVTQLHSYVSTIKVLGKHSFGPLSIKIRDDTSNSVARAVGEQVQKQMDMVNQSGAASAQDYKFQLNLEVLDGANGQFAPVVLEAWECYGCSLVNPNWGSMDYASNEFMTIDLSIEFDNAVQTPLGSGVGTQIGRLGNSFGLATGVGGGQTGQSTGG